jgi:hypothetical protein
MKIPEQYLKHFDESKTDFVSIYYNGSDLDSPLHTRIQTAVKHWTDGGCSVRKKTWSVPSAGKDMTSVFWDAESILFIYYLEKGKTITAEYYTNLLTRLHKKKIHEKRPGLQTKKKSSFIRTMHLPTKVLWQWGN